MTATLSQPPPPEPPRREMPAWFATGAIVFAVAVWGLQFVMIRLGVTTDLTGNDLAVLRFAVAGPLLLPFFFRYGWRDCAGLGWRDGLIMTCLGGLPMALLSNWGLNFAPANHASCIQPGTVGIIATVAGAIIARTGLPPLKIIGLILAIGGLVGVAFGAPAAIAGPHAWFGDIIFFISGVCWGSYTIMLARKRSSPLASTVAVGVLSMLMLPAVLAFLPSKLSTAPMSSLLLHGLFQGIVNYLIAFGLWSYAARVLGPIRMGLFSPLIPVFGVLFAMPILGEFPAPLQWLGIAAVLIGLTTISVADRYRRI